MTTRDTSGDAMEAFLRGDDLPPVTITGSEALTIKEAFEEANYALRKAETSKIFAIAKAARTARARIERAYSALLNAELRR